MHTLIVLKNCYLYHKIYDINNFPFFLVKKECLKYNTKKERSTNKRIKYIKYPATFDIESTTTTLTEHKEPEGFMYLWQFCFRGYVVMGRTWDELLVFFNRLTEECGISYEKRLVIYVHYLSFEWQFIKNFFVWSSVFAREERKILKCESVSGLEFRCSYYLSNMRLEKFCEYCGDVMHSKMKGGDGGFNYKKLRTPSTVLSNDELAYAYCDVKGLEECILFLLKEDTITTIPITSTSYVRRDMRKSMQKNKKNRDLFYKTALNENVYNACIDMKRGGNTHGSRFLAGKILENVYSFDIASSYPFELCTKKFPMGKYTKYGTIETMEELFELSNLYSLIIRILFINIRLYPAQPIPYIPLDKCHVHKNCDIFNGRILEGDEVEITCNEIDLKIINRQYNWDSVVISNVFFSHKDYLPKEFTDVVKEYYNKKTELKGINDYFYAKSKNRLNSCFGMTFTDPVRENYEYNELLNTIKKLDKDIKSSLSAYYNGRNNFLPYQWGATTTSLARYSLDQIIKISDIYTVYCDTDSDKCLDIDRQKLNKLNKEKIELSKEFGCYAYDKFGVIHYMGVYEEEKKYDRFITLGAKKYAYEIDGELHITIAGVNKELGAKELGALDNLKLGFKFKKAGGTSSYYNDMENHYININGEKIYTGSNIGIVDSEYTLGVNGNFLEHTDFDENILEEYS